MACIQTLNGILASCDTNLAGIKEVFLGNYGGFHPVVNEAQHKISGLTADSGFTLYKYEFAKQTGSLTSTVTIDETNGVRYYTHALNLQFNKLEGTKHVEIEALAAGQLVGIVHDNNDKYWYVGYDSYLSATETTAQTGQSFGDLNGYTTAMSAMSAHLPYEIDYDTFEALIDGNE